MSEIALDSPRPGSNQTALPPWLVAKTTGAGMCKQIGQDCRDQDHALHWFLAMRRNASLEPLRMCVKAIA